LLICQYRDGRRARAATSPDPDPILRLQIEPLAGLDAERLVPGVEVAHGCGAEFSRGVAVGQERLPQRLGPDLDAPDLSEGEEEPLVAAEALGGRSFLAALAGAITLVGR